MKIKNVLLGSVLGIASLAFHPLASQAQYAPPPPQPGYAPQPWEVPPAEYQAVGQKGYADGVRGARKDYENHRAPDVNNRDEYRHPNMPGRDRREYRDAFRRGYQAGVDHLMNGMR